MEKQNRKQTGTVPKGTVTVDAVHPRLLDKSRCPQKSRLAPSNEVSYCVQCKESIENTVSALRDHFQRSPHESQPCVYCSGPVYKYFFRSEENYHECILNFMCGEESNDSDTSSLSKDDSDTSDRQSISSTKKNETTSLLYVKNTESNSPSDTSSVEGTQ